MRTKATNVGTWWLAGALLAGTSSCFLGYDSRWGESKRAQQRAAAAWAPATLHASSDDRATRATTYRVLVVATPQYAAQTADWQRQVRELFDDTNQILEPEIGVHLEVERVASWTTSPPEDPLPVTLETLHRDEPGDGVDWVVGLVGGLPRVTASFHDVGFGEVLGKHVVLRAASREGEYDQVESAFGDLSEEQRARVRRDRRRHRAAAVFLHEIGHTLGAPHEIGATSIMYTAYNPKMAGFSPEAVDVMRLAAASKAKGDRDARGAAGAIADILRRASGSAPWSTEERERSIATLEGMRPRAAAAASHDAKSTTTVTSAATGDAAPPSAKDAAEGVREADRPRLAQASAQLNSGAVRTAWETAKPLFASYPDVYAVQDLRCQLAILNRLDEKERTVHCAPLKRLSPSK